MIIYIYNDQSFEYPSNIHEHPPFIHGSLYPFSSWDQVAGPSFGGEAQGFFSVAERVDVGIIYTKLARL